MVPVITISPKRLSFVFLIYDVLVTNLIVSLSQLILYTTYSTAMCYSYIRRCNQIINIFFYNKLLRDLGIGRNVFQTIVMTMKNIFASWNLHCQFIIKVTYCNINQVSLFDGNMPVYFVGIQKTFNFWLFY